MSISASGISRDEWLAAIGESSSEDDQGAITSREFAVMLGLEITAARKRMAKLVASGKAIRTSKVIRQGQWATRSVAYRLVTTKPKGRKA